VNRQYAIGNRQSSIVVNHPAHGFLAFKGAKKRAKTPKNTKKHAKKRKKAAKNRQNKALFSALAGNPTANRR
jgi:hypothetical protein